VIKNKQSLAKCDPQQMIQIRHFSQEISQATKEFIDLKKSGPKLNGVQD